MRFWTKALGFSVLCCATTAYLEARADQPANTAGKPAADASKTDAQHNGRNAPRFDATRFIKDHDKNNDGKLSKDELPATAQHEFNQMDTNKDGFISTEELQQHADRMSHQRPQLVEVVWYAIDVEEPITSQELQTAYDQLRKLDKNNDGKIDENELKSFREQRRHERVEQVFTALDRNKDGKITQDEARGLWADNFSQLDKNGDKVLDRQEVEAACQIHHPKDQNNQGGNSSQSNRK